MASAKDPKPAAQQKLADTPAPAAPAGKAAAKRGDIPPEFQPATTDDVAMDIPDEFKPKPRHQGIPEGYRAEDTPPRGQGRADRLAAAKEAVAQSKQQSQTGDVTGDQPAAATTTADSQTQGDAPSAGEATQGAPPATVTVDVGGQQMQVPADLLAQFAPPPAAEGDNPAGEDLEAMRTVYRAFQDDPVGLSQAILARSGAAPPTQPPPQQQQQQPEAPANPWDGVDAYELESNPALAAAKQAHEAMEARIARMENAQQQAAARAQAQAQADQQWSDGIRRLRAARGGVLDEQAVRQAAQVYGVSDPEIAWKLSNYDLMAAHLASPEAAAAADNAAKVHGAGQNDPAPSGGDQPDYAGMTLKEIAAGAAAEVLAQGDQ